MSELDTIRKEIDALDRDMAALYERRMDLAREVALSKKATGKPIFDAAREKTVIEKNKARIKNPDYRDLYEDFIVFLMNQSKDRQRAIISAESAAYQGIEGAFGHQVCTRLFPWQKKLAKNSFEEVVQAVTDRQVEFGVLPFENTSSGLVGEVLDLLLKYPVKIVSMTDHKVEQCLIGLPEATLKDIKTVYSKDQALMQAKEFLESLQVETVCYPNTALAARYVSNQQDKSVGALAAREAADLYGLKVLATHVEGQASNTTRFLVISADEYLEEADGTALIFTLNNKVGALGAVIDAISQEGLNMNSIQSRPIKDKPFEYFFYTQLDRPLNADQRARLEAQMMPVCSSVKWLGNFKWKEE